MNTDKLIQQIKRFAIAKAISGSVAWFCLMLMFILATIHIHDHGLKDLLELIWYGPKS